jgi:hypothetical protein
VYDCLHGTLLNTQTPANSREFPGVQAGATVLLGAPSKDMDRDQGIDGGRQVILHYHYIMSGRLCQ